MKRFITYLDDLAKRTYFGTDGTEPQRSGVLGIPHRWPRRPSRILRPSDPAGNGCGHSLPLDF